MVDNSKVVPMVIPITVQDKVVPCTGVEARYDARVPLLVVKDHGHGQIDPIHRVEAKLRGVALLGLLRSDCCLHERS